MYLQIALEGHTGQNYVVTESLWATHEAEDRLTMLRLITTPYVINYVVRLVIFTLFCFVFALKVLVCTVCNITYRKPIFFAFSHLDSDIIELLFLTHICSLNCLLFFQSAQRREPVVGYTTRGTCCRLQYEAYLL